MSQSFWTVEEASSLFDIKRQEKRQDAASTIITVPVVGKKRTAREAAE